MRGSRIDSNINSFTFCSVLNRYASHHYHVNMLDHDIEAFRLT